MKLTVSKIGEKFEAVITGHGIVGIDEITAVSNDRETAILIVRRTYAEWKNIML